MIIKNNSDLEWLNYNAGYGVYVDIKPKTTFEVSDKVGKKLLSLLGAPNWLVKVDKLEKDEKIEPKDKVQKINEEENKKAKATLDQDKPKKAEVLKTKSKKNKTKK